MEKLKGQKGFTLVELAIVLVIIGIILGAVLKGQELIKNAKYKRLYNEYREVVAATYTYYDKYQRYPGDDNTATARWAGTLDGGAQGWIDGTQYCNGSEVTESCVAWQHLRLAGIISGATDAANGRKSITHPFGGRVAIGRTDTLIAGWSKPIGVCFEWLNNETARWLEANYDDGVSTTGSIRGSADYMVGAADTVVANHTCIEL